ncbi:ribosome-associated translation inhibitor RaiA [Candidatus Parcubacteria bacterium]|nr:ribosome-associated translation inhibitor RaiA [Candidatus Parcubacteria bacterium]
MKTNFKATGIELTPAILDYAEKRFAKIGQYLEGDNHVMSVELGKTTQHHKQGNVFRAEVRISGGGADFYAARESTDLFASIDEVKDEIISEINKVKGKRRSLMRRGGRAVKDMIRGFPWFGRS